MRLWRGAISDDRGSEEGERLRLPLVPEANWQCTRNIDVF
jgi:hypothetical protein